MNFPVNWGRDIVSTGQAPEKFEDAMAALEAIVERLEQGELSLDESMRLFERGVALVRQCSRQLDEAQRKIELLLEQNGDIILKPADEFEVAEPDSAHGETDARDATA